MLHRLALGSRIVSEFSLDLETGRTDVDIETIERGRHVFITGLARSGTTILLRRLFATGAFGCLTYRDMPFVLMPLSWKWLSANSQKQVEKRERAHGDGLLVDYDSPEAFEEVFWKTVCGPDYIRKDRLLPHQPDNAATAKFKHYIGIVLKSRQNPVDRYLSKNNNNILRLAPLCAALPDSLFLVPFRSPLQHASSLLNQHLRFLDPADAFSKRYMEWLGHYEFGAGHRPFSVSNRENPYDPLSLAYWLMIWKAVYQWLAATAPEHVVFVGYERLCSDHGHTWHHLLELAEIKENKTVFEPLFLKTREISEQIPGDLLNSCDRTYQLLLDRHDKHFTK